ncbi:MAG: TnsD family Tn7-like transposition protein, partial [Lysobacteraceae bacterium]
LFGAPYAALSHDFPSRMAVLKESTGGVLGCYEQIALRNTLLGYYLSIVGRERADRVLSLIENGSIPHLKMLLGITASRVGGHHPLKACDQCMAEDEGSRGGAYWHVEHQPPSVLVCTKHERPLFIAFDAVTPVHRKRWLLPRTDDRYERIEISVQKDADLERLLRLAADSGKLAELPPAALPPERLTCGYQQILKELGLATQSGNIRLTQFMSLVRERYRGLIALPGFAILNCFDESWAGFVGSLSRRVARPGHPLKHLLLIGAISESWHQFLAACGPGKKADAKVGRAKSEAVPNALRQSQFKNLISGAGLSVSAAAKQVGVSPTTGAMWAKKLKIPYTSRRSPAAKVVAARVQRLLLKGDSIASISRSTGASMTTVYRLAETDPRIASKRMADAFSRRQRVARENFTTLCQTQSDEPLKRIRSMPGNSYTWLYRNDPDWLAAKLAEYGRVSSRSRQ